NQGQRELLSVRAGAGSSAVVAALQHATLVLRHATPHAGILAGADCPREAIRGHWATVAHQLCLRGLGESRAGVTDGEKQFGVFLAAYSLVAPIHDQVLSCLSGGRSGPSCHAGDLAGFSARGGGVAERLTGGDLRLIRAAHEL